MIYSYSNMPINYKYEVYFLLLYSIATHCSLTIRLRTYTVDTFSSYRPHHTIYYNAYFSVEQYFIG